VVRLQNTTVNNLPASYKAIFHHKHLRSKTYLYTTEIPWYWLISTKQCPQK